MFSKHRGCKTNGVTVEVNGGLGNQMFQYAFARTIADARSDRLLLDLSHYRMLQRGITPRSYALDNFRIRGEICNSPSIVSRCILPIFRYVPILSSFTNIAVERNQIVFDSLYSESSKSYFSGYWQSLLYFKNNSERIYNDFLPKHEFSTGTSSLINRVKATNSIMVHVRRGDYISSQNAASYHGSVPVEYYMRALEFCLSKLSDPTIYVFSDDIDWCKSAFEIVSAPIHFFGPDPARADWEDLMVMSFCRNHIIANSTFSWWSAWLADQRYGTTGRLVYAPHKWFCSRSVINAHFFPEHWTILNV